MTAMNKAAGECYAEPAADSGPQRPSSEYRGATPRPRSIAQRCEFDAECLLEYGHAGDCYLDEYL